MKLPVKRRWWEFHKSPWSEYIPGGMLVASDEEENFGSLSKPIFVFLPSKPPILIDGVLTDPNIIEVDASDKEELKRLSEEFIKDLKLHRFPNQNIK